MRSSWFLIGDDDEATVLYPVVYGGALEVVTELRNGALIDPLHLMFQACHVIGSEAVVEFIRNALR
jgi:hypothetical protein